MVRPDLNLDATQNLPSSANHMFKLCTSVKIQSAATVEFFKNEFLHRIVHLILFKKCISRINIELEFVLCIIPHSTHDFIDESHMIGCIMIPKRRKEGKIGEITKKLESQLQLCERWSGNQFTFACSPIQKNVKKATNKIRITVYFAYPILRPMLIFMISLIDIVYFINGTKWVSDVTVAWNEWETLSFVVPFQSSSTHWLLFTYLR